MKKLNMFTYFDFEEFAKGKRFMSISKQPWKNYDSEKIKGTKIGAVIVQDKTNYGDQAGEVVSNLYEKLIFKVPMDIDIPMNVEIRPVNPVATVYGDWRDKLSITVDNVEVISK